MPGRSNKSFSTNEYAAQLKGTLTDSERAQLGALRLNPAMALAGFNEKYLADLKGYDPVLLAKTMNTPMLILQGERDFHDTLKNFALWKTGLAGRSTVVLKSYPKLNHLFAAGEGKSTPEEYDSPAHVAPDVIDDVARWLSRAR